MFVFFVNWEEDILRIDLGLLRIYFVIFFWFLVSLGSNQVILFKIDIKGFLLKIIDYFS